MIKTKNEKCEHIEMARGMTHVRVKYILKAEILCATYSSQDIKMIVRKVGRKKSGYYFLRIWDGHFNLAKLPNYEPGRDLRDVKRADRKYVFMKQPIRGRLEFLSEPVDCEAQYEIEHFDVVIAESEILNLSGELVLRIGLHYWQNEKYPKPEFWDVPLKEADIIERLFRILGHEYDDELTLANLNGWASVSGRFEPGDDCFRCMNLEGNGTKLIGPNNPIKVEGASGE